METVCPRHPAVDLGTRLYCQLVYTLTDLLPLIRVNAGDIVLVMRLNAQFGSMVRRSLSVHGHLMRVQALRRKRETIDGADRLGAENVSLYEVNSHGAAFETGLSQHTLNLAT